MTATDRPGGLNTDCEHPIARHRHGSYVTYVWDRCRCPECKSAHSRYEKTRRRWQGEFPRELHPLVPAARARAHLKDLMSQGMSLKRMAAIHDLSHGVLSSIVYGRKNRPYLKIRRDTEDRILAVTLDVADGAKVDRAEADAIIEELLARGWTKSAIAREVTGPRAAGLQFDERQVYARTIRRLRELVFVPVPEIYHSRWDKCYPQDTGHRSWVFFETPGIPWSPEDVDRLSEMTRRQALEMDRARLRQTLEENSVVTENDAGLPITDRSFAKAENRGSRSVLEHLRFLGTWEPVRGLAAEFNIGYPTMTQAVRRWEKRGLVETRSIELGKGRGGFIDHRFEVRAR